MWGFPGKWIQKWQRNPAIIAGQWPKNVVGRYWGGTRKCRPIFMRGPIMILYYVGIGGYQKKIWRKGRMEGMLLKAAERALKMRWASLLRVQ